MKEFDTRKAALMSLFCGSGIAHPLIISKISYEGGSEPSTLLYLIPSSFGLCVCSVHLWIQARKARRHELVIEEAGSILNTLVIGNSNRSRGGRGGLSSAGVDTCSDADRELLDEIVHHRRTEIVGMALPGTPWVRLLLLCFCDMASSCMHMLGLLMAGSSIFIMAYSSVTITTAIMSRIYLQRHMHWVQWVGLFIIAVGLSISGIIKGNIAQGGAVHIPVSNEHAFSEAYPDLIGGSYSNTGVLMITLASFMHAFCYVLTESLMTADQVSPEMLCSCLGFSSMTIYSIWQLWWTIPRWSELVSTPIAMHGDNIVLVLLLYLYLSLNNLVHSLCFFYFVVELGSVSVSVIKGLQSVALFVLSNALFCGSDHPEQCWSRHKGISLGVTLVGVVVFNAFRLPSNLDRERELEGLLKEEERGEGGGRGGGGGGGGGGGEGTELVGIDTTWQYHRYSYDSIVSTADAHGESTTVSSAGGTSKETTLPSQRTSGSEASGEVRERGEEKGEWRM